MLAATTWIAPLLVWSLAANAGEPESCLDRSEERHAYFGVLHIHTGPSADAMLFETTNRPDDAYRFARGESISIRKMRGGAALVDGRIGRPLDFAAVIDHFENIGEVSLCLVFADLGQLGPLNASHQQIITDRRSR